MLLRSGLHFLPLLLLFPPLVFLQLTYIFQLLIFSLMLPLLSELKTSVSSRVAYLDYHCLLAQWMEVSISVTTAGFTEQTRNSKSRFMAFTAPKVVPASWHELFGWILKKDTTVGFLISNCTVHQIMTENPTLGFDWNCWQSILSCVFTLWCITWS